MRSGRMNAGRALMLRLPKVGPAGPGPLSIHPSHGRADRARRICRPARSTPGSRAGYRHRWREPPTRSLGQVGGERAAGRSWPPIHSVAIVRDRPNPHRPAVRQADRVARRQCAIEQIEQSSDRVRGFRSRAVVAKLRMFASQLNIRGAAPARAALACLGHGSGGPLQGLSECAHARRAYQTAPSDRETRQEPLLYQPIGSGPADADHGAGRLYGDPSRLYDGDLMSRPGASLLVVDSEVRERSSGFTGGRPWARVDSPGIYPGFDPGAKHLIMERACAFRCTLCRWFPLGIESPARQSSWRRVQIRKMACRGCGCCLAVPLSLRATVTIGPLPPLCGRHALSAPS